MEEYSSPEKYDEEKSRKGKKSKNPRRFSDDQIRSLESIFKVDTKLEARKKAEVAKELGLQPKQVAIWFQNKRARWKSRQIEQEYKVLRANYDSLNTQFHELKREKHSLQMQLDELSGLIKKLEEKNSMSNGNDEMKACGNTRSNEEIANSSNVITIKVEDEKEIMRWDEEEEISHLSSPRPWCSLDLFDHSMSAISISNWWDT